MIKKNEKGKLKISKSPERKRIELNSKELIMNLEKLREDVKRAYYTMKKLRCKHCGYSWISRVEKPKECPDCKARLKLRG